MRGELFMKKVLLDTNMYIYLEENRKITDDIMKIIKLLYDSDQLKMVIHPQTFKEIEKFPKVLEREIFLSKISVFPKIENPPVPPEDFHELLGHSNENDKIDNELLYAVRQNCVEYLITNDNKLVSKSKKINLSDRVLSVSRAIEKFNVSIEEERPSRLPVFINFEYLYNIDVDESFFDSLRKNYFKFNNWFSRKQAKEEKAYITRGQNGKVTSFLMLKVEGEDETYDFFSKPFKPLKRLKISTFKVEDRGKKIGEAFIKVIIDTALIEGVKEIYVTVFSKYNKLISLLEKYGFVYHGEKQTRDGTGKNVIESIYVKPMDNEIESYPYVHIKDKNVFIVPVQPQYHRKLFPESEDFLQLSFDDAEGGIPVSNSIEKAYISNSNTKQIRPNDILLFYASRDKKAITTLGIVDMVFTDFDTLDELVGVVNKRTAYEIVELENQFKRTTLVILFKHYLSFPNPVPFDFLLKNNVVLGNIQKIQKIDSDKLEMIVNECKVDLKLIKKN